MRTCIARFICSIDYSLFKEVPHGLKSFHCLVATRLTILLPKRPRCNVMKKCDMVQHRVIHAKRYGSITA